jgi:hypothetical protein
MPRNWGDYDRRRKVTYTIDDGTTLARIGLVGSDLSLLVGDHLVLRLTPTAAARVARLLQAAGS